MPTIKKIYKNGTEYQMPQGPKGDQGDSVLVGQGDLPLAHVTGQDNTKAMSQKGVTDAIGDFKVQSLTRLKDCYINNGAIASSSSQHCWWAPIKSGEIVKVTGTNSSSKTVRVGFCSTKPAVEVSVSSVVSQAGTSVSITNISDTDGYVVINHVSGNFSDHKLEVLKFANAGEVSSKAESKSLTELLQAASVIVGENALVETSILDVSPFFDGFLQNYNDAYNTYAFSVEEGKIYKIKGRTPATTGYVGYMFVDQYDHMVAKGVNSTTTATNFTTSLIVCPKGATTLYVSGYSSVSTTIKGEAFEITQATTEEQKALVRSNLGIADAGIKTIYPKMGFEHIQGSTGKHNDIDKEFKFVSTIRFVKVNGSFTATTHINCKIRVYKYAGDFSFINHDEYTLTTDTPVTVDPANAAYIKIMVSDTMDANAGTIPMVKLSLTGRFENNWDYFNIDQNKVDQNTNYGRQTIIARVYVTDPTCCDDTTNSVQDDGEILSDYGCLQLPATYQNTGEPTRLIIYCHGAAVNYNTYGFGDISGNPGTYPRFEPQDLEPGYWLHEGYAVMDVEGNPYNNTDEHFSMPQAMDCYVAAYKWVIEHYNIKRDGVFLGGRSMGGGTSITLTRDECPIPVLAVCPNAAAAMTSFGASSERKTFWATHCGFVLPDGFSFGNGYIEAEKQVFLDNWNKWVKYTPLLGWINDLPITDQEKSAFLDMMWSDNRYTSLQALRAHCKCPVKFFGCYEDTTCPPEKTAQVYYKMLMNTGQRAEMRLFHSTIASNKTHHYDTQDDNLRCEVTTKYGEEMTNIPVVYVEMLRFWRRYEQE